MDSLRGLTIAGMILCSAIGWYSGLPAWMFHCQVPPPDYVFSPEVRGITWVDLVFPFFIFAMGAALPLSLGRKLEKGATKMSLVPGILKRWAVLTAFALILGNAYNAQSCQAPELLKGVFAVAMWGALFVSLVRTEKKWLNPAGYALVALLLVAAKFLLKAQLSIHATDIIIMILAVAVLVGSLLWLLTTGCRWVRALVFFLVLGIKALLSYTALELPQMPQWLSWAFSPEWLEYLLIVIPAAKVGEMLAADSGSPVGKNAPLRAALLVLTTLVQLWGLYTRNVAADAIISALLATLYFLLDKDSSGAMKFIPRLGFVMLMAGIAFDFPDGGIAKDYCNISYLLVTGGLAALMTAFFRILEVNGKKLRVLPLCGQNPMIAYTIVGFLLSPVLYAVGLLPLLDSPAEGSVVWGLLRGFFVTAAMCACTMFFTKKKIFWRS